MTLRTHFFSILFAVGLCTVLLLATPIPAMATQPHGDTEGVVVHQFSHLFFIFSTTILIYWLRNRKLDRQPGWREIKYASFFLILWSADAFVVHLLDEQLEWVVTTRIDPWTMHLESRGIWGMTAWVYYIAKFDHLLCVPGLYFLYRGLSRLSALKDAEMGKGDSR